MDEKWFWIAIMTVGISGLVPAIIKEWRGTASNGSKVEEYRKCLRIENATEKTCREIIGLDSTSNNN